MSLLQEIGESNVTWKLEASVVFNAQIDCIILKYVCFATGSINLCAPVDNTIITGEPSQIMLMVMSSDYVSAHPFFSSQTERFTSNLK